MSYKQDYEEGLITWREYLEAETYRYCLELDESELTKADREFLASLKQPMQELDLPLAPAWHSELTERQIARNLALSMLKEQK